MARRGPRNQPAPDLTATIADLAARIGDRIGAGIARAIEERTPSRGRAPAGGTCSREGCSRPVAAKGLCKSHYNLMLYHRRKAETAGKGRKGARTKRRRS